MKVERKISGQRRPSEYLRNQLAVSRPEQHGVMGKLRMLSLEAEIDHKQRHRVAFLRQCSTVSWAGGGGSKELGVGGDPVGVSGHCVEREAFPAREPHPGSLVPHGL